MDRDTGAIVAALILAPAAVTLMVALLRGYKVDIHFERGDEGRGILSRRKRKADPPADADTPDDDNPPS